MKTAFIIYSRAVGFYALLTLPLIVLPAMYMMSLVYVLIYGWFAWGLFSVTYLLIDKFLFDFVIHLLLLFLAVAVAVGFAYHMLEVLGVHHDVWHSEYILFPFIAIISGWISLCFSGERIRNAVYEHTI